MTSIKKWDGTERRGSDEITRHFYPDRRTVHKPVKKVHNALSNLPILWYGDTDD